MVRAGPKISSTTLIDVDICHCKKSLRKSYSVTLTHIFKVKIVNNQ